MENKEAAAVPEVKGPGTNGSRLDAKDSSQMSSSSESNLSGSTAHAEIMEDSETPHNPVSVLKPATTKDATEMTNPTEVDIPTDERNPGEVASSADVAEALDGKDAANTVNDGSADSEADDSPEGKAERKARRKKAKLEEGAEISEDSADSGDNDEDDEWLASYYGERMSSKMLYKAYTNKLARAEMTAESTTKKQLPKGPKMVKGLIDYLRVLEDRIGKLETKPPEEENPTAKVDEAEKKETSGDSTDAGVKLETRFYDCANEASVDFLDQVTNDLHKEHGSFSSEVDPKHMIRVLHKWQSKSWELSEGAKPGAGDIDILALRISSEPIAQFFEHIAAFEVHRDNLVLMRKPFRFLIRGASKIKGQLAKLEAQYSLDQLPYADKEGGPGTPSKKDNLRNASTNEQPPAQATTSGRDDETPTPPYDSQEALLHFKELVVFIDTYLGKWLQLYDDLRSQRRMMVAFKDLWMLFDYQDIVYCPFKNGGITYITTEGEEVTPSRRRDVPQAYSVLGTTGGILLDSRVLPPKEKTRAITETTGLLQALQNLPPDNQGQTFFQQPALRAKDWYTPLYISCYYLDFDGIRLKAMVDFFVIKPYEGEIDINALEVRPIKHPHPSAGEHPKVKELAERGKRFLEYTSITHLDYDGLAVGGNREEINSPVMIDFKEAFQEKPSLVPPNTDNELFWSRIGLGHAQELPRSCSNATCHDPDCLNDTYVSHQSAQSSKILSNLNTLLEEYEADKAGRMMKNLASELEKQNLLLLLPGVVYGYALRNRKWLELDIRRLKNPLTNDNKSGWEDLVLPEDHRLMVQSMVEVHSAVANTAAPSKKARNEIGLVQGKGKGCIILLHGVPGVGKTSTAECVASYTRRPLFPITCGDIGYEPETLEKNLEDLFKLAHKWGCVLLIDEADVFLAERDKKDVKRNGLVSVFLRVLEYYSGILFLTTNRVGSFDDAFRSRIHLTLYYPKLTAKYSKEVWKTNFKRLERMNKSREEEGLPKINLDKKKILKFASMNYEALQWNGRQIQNAFHTALSLAQFEVKDNKHKGPRITTDHFEIIANATIQFDDYLKEVHLGDESKKAKNAQLRADNSISDAPRKIRLPEMTSEESSESSEEDSSEEERKRRRKKKSKSKQKSKKEAFEDQSEPEGSKQSRAKPKKRQAQASDEDEDSSGKRNIKTSKAKKTKKKAKDSDYELESTHAEEKARKSKKKGRKEKPDTSSSEEDHSK